MAKGQKKKKKRAERGVGYSGPCSPLGLLLMDDFNHQRTNEIYSYSIIKRISLIIIEVGGHKKKVKKVLPDSVSSARKKSRLDLQPDVFKPNKKQFLFFFFFVRIIALFGGAILIKTEGLLESQFSQKRRD